MSNQHREVPIKVNAWVDEGIAPLVEALNRFPGVFTLDSCQGDADDYETNEDGEVKFRRPAYVYFRCRMEQETMAFLGVFVAELRKLSGDSFLWFSLWLEWLGLEDNDAVAEVRLNPNHVSQVAETINRVADGWE